MVTMLGWLSAEAALASRAKRRFRSAVDHTHAAFAEPLQDAEVGEGLAQHVAF
jgi:hypothetical protein